MSRKAGLPPVARADARLLILGSLPGDASLAAAQYYAHPRNHFWPLVGAVIGADLVQLGYPARLETLQSAGIALWDVVGEAIRPGSLDQKIRAAQVNDLQALVQTLPQLRAIAFNGRKAALLGTAALRGVDIELVALPSSSPAYTLDLPAKLAAWSTLSRFLQPLEH